MSRILHISCSPRAGRSFSTRVADEFMKTYREAHPADTAASLDLFTAAIPEFAGPEASAKYAVMAGQEPRDEAARSWVPVIETISHFKTFDKYVLSTAMWNFGIPYRLKQYIDVLVQPGLTFSYSPKTGYTGLVTRKKAVLVLARGGDFSAPGAASLDHQRSYLQQILGFIGISDVQTLTIEPTIGDQAESVTSAAIAQARTMAASF